NDSKLLTPLQRNRLARAIRQVGHAAVGVASVEEIATLNIHHATFLAMQRAVARLRRQVSWALVDGKQAPDLGCQVRTVVGGDGKCLSIAAASVVAKVTRHRFMARLSRDCPGYGWRTNVGYGTDQHYL